MIRNIVPADRRASLHRIATDLQFCTERFDREEFRRPDETPTYPKRLHESEREVLAPLLEEGFEVVGCGIARCVLRFPRSSPLAEYVVKLPRFGIGPVSFGPAQNEREVSLWTRHGEAGDWPLVPVADYERERFAWLAMPYGEPLSDRPEAEREEWLRQVRSQLRFLPAFDMREVFAANIVLVDETPLVADYGLPDGA